MKMTHFRVKNKIFVEIIFLFELKIQLLLIVMEFRV